MAETLLSIGLEVAAIHILGIIAACHAVMNTRTSQGAVAWAVALVSIPYLTLIPYLFLGRSRFAGYVDEHRFNSARARARTSSSTNMDAMASAPAITVRSSLKPSAGRKSGTASMGSGR